MSLSSISCSAATPVEQQQVRQHIQEILQHEDFQTRKTVTEWRYKNQKHSAEEKNRVVDLPSEVWRRLSRREAEERDVEESDWFSLPSHWLLWLAQLAELLLWALLLLGLLALLWALYRHTHGRLWRKQRRQAVPLTELEMMLQNNQMLAEQPAQAAWLFWQQGQPRAAVSLLYRASLEYLRQHEGLCLPDSATEGECLRLIKRTQAQTRSQYCARLTRTWQTLAYAHQLPEESIVRSLCNDWETQFLQGRTQ